MEKTTFDLGPEAAAIIFNGDMSTELILPKMGEEDIVDFDNNQNIFVAMAVVSLLDDDEFRKFVGAKLEVMLETAEALGADDKNVVDAEFEECPSGGCACCDVEHPKDPGDGS